jgi:hypothetical protein
VTEIVNDKQAALYAALAKAQGAFAPIAKNRAVQIRMKEGGTYRFEYADLEASIAATRPALTVNGLAVVQSIGNTEGLHLDTVLVHADGGMMYSRVPLPNNDMRDPKAFGAILTYLRRYEYNALLCLAADDDLDEDGTGVEDVPQTRKEEPAPKARAKEPDAEAEMASPGQLNWLKKKLESIGGGADLLKKHGLAEVGPMSTAAFEKLKTEAMRG